MSDLLSWILENQDSFRKNRLPSLYSDFSTQKQTNPDGYDTNVAAWQKALSQAALAGQLNTTALKARSRTRKGDGTTPDCGNIVVLSTSDQLASELETKEYGRPIALQCVIDELTKSGALMPLDYFLTTQTSPFKKSWIPSISLLQLPSAGQVMGWSVRTLKGLLIPSSEEERLLGRLRQGEYVIVANLKVVAEHIVKEAGDDIGPTADRIFSKESFAKEHCTWNDVLIAFAHSGSQTLKFLTPSEPAAITQEDTTIASLKTAISELNVHITRLEHVITSLTSQIQIALASKNRVAAASALRKRKLAENRLQIRTNTLFQLESVYLNIQQAQDQIGIVNVMRESTKTLRGLNDRVGGIDNVQDIVDELRSEMDTVDEVSHIVHNTGGAAVIDEDEIGHELAKLMEADKESAESEETKNKLAALEAFEKEAKAKKERKPGEGTQEDADMDLEESLGRLSIQEADEDREREGRVAAQ
ncbi:hypothetical protein KEM54_003124 [Ascosphaera aggregata]|nr:hypothetical protein KEM54_003124 [Ascosphaera aggregata]